MTTPDWYTEGIADHTRISYAVRRRLYEADSAYQRIEILDLARFGPTLFLDGMMQCAATDERLYHEALVHPALLAHPAPRSVLVVGGGDGGALREALKHPTVERAVLAELDPDVISAARAHLPGITGGALDDARTEIVLGDARDTIADRAGAFDAILLDLTEPVEEGVSSLLFTRELYDLAARALTPQGAMAVQAADASPGRGQLLADVCATLGAVAPRVRPLTMAVPSFLGIWGFAVAAWERDPAARPDPERVAALGELHALTPGRVAAAFEIPPYLETTLEKGEVRTDASPFVWPG